MKKKVKICMNMSCTNRVNKPDAAVCAGCGSSFRGMSWKFLNDEEIERLLHPKEDAENGQEDASHAAVADGAEDAANGTAGTAGQGGGAAAASAAERAGQPGGMVIVCPSCGRRIPYRVGLEFCECGEYVQEEIPVSLAADTGSAVSCVQEVTALRTLDGLYRLELAGDWMKVGRQAAGQDYFGSHGKFKVCREHAILRRIDGHWQISYCKREDRNYSGGVENPIFINGRRLERQEEYRLKPGDEIAFAESDPSDSMAAFFRAE